MSLSHPSFSFFPSWHDLLSLLIFFPSPSVGSRRIGRSDNGGISFLESATTPPPRILWAWLEYRSKSSIESALPVSQQKLLTYPPPSTRTLFLFLSSGRFDISVWGGKGRRERGIYPLPVHMMNMLLALSILQMYVYPFNIAGKLELEKVSPSSYERIHLNLEFLRLVRSLCGTKLCSERM